MNKKSDRNLIEHMLSYLSIPEDERQNGCESEYGQFSSELKDFLDEIPGGFLIYHADAPEKVIYANKALLRIFGCGSEREFYEHTGGTFKGIVHPDDYERVEQSIIKQIRGDDNKFDYVEYRITRTDGTVRWVEDYGHYIHNKSVGDIYYVFISDATEKIKKRILEKAELINRETAKEQELKYIKKEHLRRLELIDALSVNYDSIFYVDLEQDTITVYQMSDRIQSMFKNVTISYAEFIKGYVKACVHPEDRENVKAWLSPELVRKHLSENKVYFTNYRCVNKKVTQYLQLSLVNVGNDTDVNQVVIGTTNVSEEVQQNLIKNKALQDALNNARLADIARKTFLSNISHDMRTPLNAILGFAALARKNLDNKQLVIECIEKSQEAGARILDQIDKVLQISYMESHGAAVQETECDLCALLSDATKILRVEAKKKNITVSLHDDIEHNKVYADVEKLRQVLIHLGTNAVKYTNSGGKVEILLTESEPKEGFVTYEFKIKDNGVGISPEMLPKIFDKFEREKNTTHSGVFGVGLGLPIAKHIIELMGGNIAIESKVDEGSTFTVTLNLKICGEPQCVGCGKCNSQSKLQGKRVLIVEDNELNLELELELLGDLGLVCDTAENGKIAVEKVRSVPADYYSFIVMDIQMPVMDGWEATRTIRALEDTVAASIPIIALSANSFESDKMNSVQAGMNAHLNKPVNIDELVEAINKYVH